MTMKKFMAFFIIILTVALMASLYQSRFGKTSVNPSAISPTTALTNNPKAIEVIAGNLEIPWALIFLLNKDILFTERTGSLKMISNGNITTINKFPDVKVYGEGGLLGLA
ncbi:MAG: PQQ-dependent sugar dehydrogenase, partial [Patescibacteria group bacterium]